MVESINGRGLAFRALLRLQQVFSFPHPVNEVVARYVAGMVAALSIAIIISDLHWLVFVLAYGFLARVLAGPTLSPFAFLAIRVMVPLLGNHKKMVPGPPKRFAQAIGLAFSTTASILIYPFGLTVIAEAVLAALAIFAVMESCLGFCSGCYVFGLLMKLGLVPEEICRRCASIEL